MQSRLVRRSVIVAGRKISFSLEEAFWRGLKEMAAWRDVTLSDLVASIDSDASEENLASAIRLFVLNFYRHQLFAADHLLRSVAPLPDVRA
ncbi:MAG TPA: ribbon-helix-helix domain-containing protein [Xanthobacteraceae bacterium]|jgi:predicted DNA-binding ribbon-helix-helix protein